MRIIADNLRVTQKVIEIAVAENNPLPLQAVVKRCQAAGADGIDINSGPLYRDPESRMTFMVEAVQQVTRLPLILDTSNPKALKAGLLACKTPATLNGLSLEPAKLEHILPLATAHQADIVCYLLYPNGHVPPDGSERLNVAVSLYQKCLEAGVEPDRVIIDPVVAPLSWQDGLFQAREVLTVIKDPSGTSGLSRPDHRRPVQSYGRRKRSRQKTSGRANLSADAGRSRAEHDSDERPQRRIGSCGTHVPPVLPGIDFHLGDGRLTGYDGFCGVNTARAASNLELMAIVIWAASFSKSAVASMRFSLAFSAHPR